MCWFVQVTFYNNEHTSEEFSDINTSEDFSDINNQKLI